MQVRRQTQLWRHAEAMDAALQRLCATTETLVAVGGKDDPALMLCNSHEYAMWPSPTFYLVAAVFMCSSHDAQLIYTKKRRGPCVVLA